MFGELRFAKFTRPFLKQITVAPQKSIAITEA